MASTRGYHGEAHGRRFRSWGEAQIGRMLDRYGIPYLYEHPLAIVDDQGKTGIWHPDFQLRGYGILLEYCGRLHDSAYTDGMARKRDVYEAKRSEGLDAYARRTSRQLATEDSRSD